MYTIIIFSIIGLALGIRYEYKDSSYFEFAFYLGNGFIGLILGAVFGCLVAWAIPGKLETRTDIFKLENLKDNNSMKGSFFLGCGTINNEMKYVFYYKCGDGVMLGQINCNDAVVEYTDSLPRLQQIVTEPVKDALINKFSLTFTKEIKNTLFVPRGTIKGEYSLDAQ